MKKMATLLGAVALTFTLAPSTVLADKLRTLFAQLCEESRRKQTAV